MFQVAGTRAKARPNTEKTTLAFGTLLVLGHKPSSFVAPAHVVDTCTATTFVYVVHLAKAYRRLSMSAQQQ